jgi:hypothetical protein
VHAEPTSALRTALHKLDALLTVAVDRAEREFAPRAELDALRGLQISGDDVRRALRDLASKLDGSRDQDDRGAAPQRPVIKDLIGECELAHLAGDPNYVKPLLLVHYVRPDEQIVRFLVGDGDLKSRLAGAGGCFSRALTFRSFR